MNLIPLATLPEGSKAVVRDVVGGRGAMRKLMSMGIIPGREIEVLGRRGGAMLILINGTKFVIGRGLAMKVIVDVGKEG
ncbi:MAG: ferrous iron transport protein A [Archaeoglobales archaeon]|nr:MAG: ferrous iron transport protein A [Archaeoglobales archaeon]